MIRLVIDTNVLVSANLSNAGLEAIVVSLALHQKIRLCVSEAILAEYERVLRYPRLKFQNRHITMILAQIRQRSILVRPTRTVSASPDEADNRFLECAEAARADYVVTGNKKHFPNAWKTTQVVNAREFLSKIGPSFLK